MFLFFKFHPIINTVLITRDLNSLISLRVIYFSYNFVFETISY